MNIEELNRKFIDKYMNIDSELKSESSFPFLIEFNQHSNLDTVPIYFKQPRDWLSSCYEKELNQDVIYNKLMLEYVQNFKWNEKYAPIRIFNTYKNRLVKEYKNITIVYNNLIKFSLRSGVDKSGETRNPDCYDGKLVDQFTDFIGQEYDLLQPTRSVFCIGPDEDYTGFMSWKMLNDVEIINLTPEKPYNVYLDKFGNPVLHTFHPSYWFKIDIDLEEKIFQFIIGDKIN